MILFGQKKGLAMSKNLTVKIAEVTIAIEGHDVLEVLPTYVPFRFFSSILGPAGHGIHHGAVR